LLESTNLGYIVYLMSCVGVGSFLDHIGKFIKFFYIKTCLVIKLGVGSMWFCQHPISSE